MKEQIKIALLAVIAATLIVNTYTQMSGGSATSSAASNRIVASSNNNDSKPSATIADAQNSKFDPLANKKDKAASAIDNKPKTTMNFANFDHDFGNIQQDSENKYVFKFTNTGKEPLIIDNAKGSCGCTVPNYPKEPIAPGATGEIEVIYKPGKQKDQQNKTVTVTANTEPTNTILKIKAMVEVVE